MLHTDLASVPSNHQYLWTPFWLANCRERGIIPCHV